MAKNNNLTDFLTDVADAIRVKRDKTDLINPQDFHDEILAIETGSSGPIIEGNGEYEVVFIDFDGTELKIQYVNEGESATPPDLPEHEYLTFNEWVGDYTNIQYDTVIGAHYRSSDWFTRFYTKMCDYVVLGVTVKGNCVIDWGDGNTTNAVSGDLGFTHKYNNPGRYWISISTSSVEYGSYTYIFSGIDGIVMSRNSVANSAFAQSAVAISWVILPTNVSSLGYLNLKQSPHLSALIIPSNIADKLIMNQFYEAYYKYICFPSTWKANNSIGDCFATQAFEHMSNLKRVNLKLLLESNMFSGDISLERLTCEAEFSSNPGCLSCEGLYLIHLKESIVYLSHFNYCSSLIELVLPISITSVHGHGSSGLMTAENLRRLIVKNPTPPVFDTELDPSSYNWYIYVPDASVNAYKTATGWSDYAEKIKGISELY